MTTKSESKAIVGELKLQIALLFGFLAVIWGIEVIDVLLMHGRLDTYGIIPRHLIGLRGIVLAPLLHGGFAHLAANSIPFVVLGWLIMLRETRDIFVVSIVTMLVGGLGVWLVGSHGVHIGASGVIFGYFGFLVLRGYFERSAASIAIAVIVVLLYGGLIWGVFPTQLRVSWEGHLFGFLGGVLAARLMSKRFSKARRPAPKVRLYS